MNLKYEHSKRTSFVLNSHSPSSLGDSRRDSTEQHGALSSFVLRRYPNWELSAPAEQYLMLHFRVHGFATKWEKKFLIALFLIAPATKKKKAEVVVLAARGDVFG